MPRELYIIAHRLGDHVSEDCTRTIEYTNVVAGERNWDTQDLRLAVKFAKELDERNWFTDSEPPTEVYWRLVTLCNRHKPHKTSIVVFGPLESPEQAVLVADSTRQHGEGVVTPFLLSPADELIPVIYTKEV